MKNSPAVPFFGFDPNSSGISPTISQAAPAQQEEKEASAASEELEPAEAPARSTRAAAYISYGAFL